MKLKEIKKALTEYIVETKGTGDEWGICSNYGYTLNPNIGYVVIHIAQEVQGEIDIQDYHFEYYQLNEVGLTNFFNNSEKVKFTKIRKFLYYFHY